MPRSCASEALRKSHGRKGGEGGADLYKYRRITPTRSLRHKFLRSRPLPTGERRNFVPPPRRVCLKEREAREVVLPMESAARTGTSMKRVLLSLLAIGGVFYPAFVFFAGNDANHPVTS